jgi:ribosome-associated protein
VGALTSEPIAVNATLEIPAEALSYEFSRSGGPGGQHVNKTDTRVRLSFDLAATELIPPAAKRRLAQQQAAWMTADGKLVLTSDATRSRHRNIEDVRDRLAEAIRTALIRPKPRVPTRPSRGAKERRLGDKRKRAEVKTGRQRPRGDD